MNKTMQAAVVERYGQPLTLREVDIPAVGPGQILVKTEACGVCHTDLHCASGDFPVKATLPFIPGHEGIGLVVAIGAGVTSVKEGDRVGVPWLYSACGHCEYCLTAWETVCAKAQFGGYTRNGGFAEYILADPDYVAHVPSSLAATEAAPIICAGITTYSPLKHWNIQPGQKVGVVGLGGLGHMALKFAHAFGAHVTQFTTSPGKEADAKRLGADEVVLTRDPEALKPLAGTFHFILDTVSAPHDLNLYLNLLKRDGAMVLVGLPENPAEVSAFPLAGKRRSLAGSNIGGIAETQEMLDFCAEHGIVSDIEMIPISKVNEAYERMLKNDVKYRFVIDMASLRE